MSPNAAFRVGFRNLLCVKRGTFEMEKGTNGYLLPVVLWFLREGDVTIYGLYCSKRWDNDRIAIERFSDIYFIVSNPS